MKRDRKKYSRDIYNGRRRSLSYDRDTIRRRRKRLVDSCNNTLSLSTRASEKFKLNEDALDDICEIVDVVSSNTRKSSTEVCSDKERSPTRESSPEIEFISISYDTKSSSDAKLLTKKTTRKDSSRNSPSNTSSAETLTDKAANCQYCRIANDSIINASRPLVGAHEEEDVLNFREIRSSWKTDKPLLRLADYRVYDKARHLCPFDGNLIKRNVSLYFSGFVKPGDSKTDDRHDGYPCEDMGPITEWWFFGFDLGQKVVCGFSSELADYCLTRPLEEYAPFVADLNEKIYVAKTVIDCLQESKDDEMSYEALLEKLQIIEPPVGSPKVTEDILLKNAAFICEQILSFDSSADVDDQLLSLLPCIRQVSEKVKFDMNMKHETDDEDEGEADLSDEDIEDDQNEDDDEEIVDVSDDEIEFKRRSKPKKHRERMSYKFATPAAKASKLTKAATTRLVENIFENFFHGQIIRRYYGDNQKNHSTHRAYNNIKYQAKYRAMRKDFTIHVTKLEDMGVNIPDDASESIDLKQYPILDKEQDSATPPKTLKGSMIPIIDEPAVSVITLTDEPIIDEVPVSTISLIDEPTNEEPSLSPTSLRDEPIIDEPSADKPIIDEPSADKPIIDEPSADKPIIEKPSLSTISSTDEPIIDEPSAEEPIIDEPSPSVISLIDEPSDPEISANETEPSAIPLAESPTTSTLSNESNPEDKGLTISLPITRELKSVMLTPMSYEAIEQYLDKYQTGRRSRKRKPQIEYETIDLLSDSDEESYCAPKRKRKNKYDDLYIPPEEDAAPKRKNVAKKSEIKNNDSYIPTVDELRGLLKCKRTRTSYQTNIKWAEEPFKEIDGFDYYKSVLVNNTKVGVGDFVSTYKTNSIGLVKYLWENNDGEKLFHAHWFTRSLDTILGEVGHPNEVFESNSCEDVPLDEIHKVVNVEFIKILPDWRENGNVGIMKWLHDENDPCSQLFCQKRYCEKTGRFEDLEPDFPSSFIDCFNCERQRKLVQREIPYSEEKAVYNKEENSYDLSMIRWRDVEYRVGTCIFLLPGTILKSSSKGKENIEAEEDYDEELYPEKYRKPANPKSIQDDDVSYDPFEIGYITGIWSKKQEISSPADVKLELKKFYRPHNTSLSPSAIRKLDLNLVYWSDNECTVEFSKVQGKCWVSYKGNLDCSLDEWFNKGPNRFYFSESYNKKMKEFVDPPAFAKKIGKLEARDDDKHVDVPPEYPPVSRPLKSLDVFAGCGGLTEGLHQANIAECHWAIEKDKAAASAFRANYPNATVFTDDCNELLNAVYERKETIRHGKRLPQRGEVELLCGGPPCQGYSGMNRFRFGQWSKFNNSLIVSYLSYCDYYKPRFFIMENVRNFVSHEKGIVFKLTLNCLLKMGYQVAFAVLQSGRFGIPQSRRRIIILAAGPGEELPLHPEPTHTFAQNGFESINLDDRKYSSNCVWTTSAPYRMITVYDALSDLPPIKEGDLKTERPYGREPVTHFQRQLRIVDDVEETMLRDHISKSLSALVVKRLSFIPKKPGCDWRDLPNIVVKLNDGTYAKKLEYTHHDARQGKSKNGALRGVCSCANNGTCKAEFRQGDTLIPWCLPHTSNRHGHWRGLYGRLAWDEYFRTVVTNPEPMGKQGRVVHPEEDRVLSVRECARSQGFPDRFKFFGYILDKHRQVGNAVAPPLAKAIGLEIRNSVHKKESKLLPSVN